MVKVATSIDAPIKILFPKSKYLFLNNSHGFALLGGGDIIVPGLWCGLCLRYDWCVPPYFPPRSLFTVLFVLTRYVHRSRSPLASKHAQQLQERRRLPIFDKPFFSTSLVAYVLGLGMTIGAMHWFEAAQPALLYIWYVWLPSLALSLSLSRTYYLPGSDYSPSLSFFCAVCGSGATARHASSPRSSLRTSRAPGRRCGRGLMRALRMRWGQEMRGRTDSQRADYIIIVVMGYRLSTLWRDDIRFSFFGTHNFRLSDGKFSGTFHFGFWHPYLFIFIFISHF